MTNHPNRSKSHTYVVESYRPARGSLIHARVEVVAATADAALAMASHRPAGDYASLTRRWQNSPVAADRDNCHAQANAAGTIGWAVWRVDCDPAAADHRSDVATARAWVSGGKSLSDLQKYGAYKTVTKADLVGISDNDASATTDALARAGYKAEI